MTFSARVIGVLNKYICRLEPPSHYFSLESEVNTFEVSGVYCLAMLATNMVDVNNEPKGQPTSTVCTSYWKGWSSPRENLHQC